jgi:hypothetical protein
MKCILYSWFQITHKKNIQHTSAYCTRMQSLNLEKPMNLHVWFLNLPALHIILKVLFAFGRSQWLCGLRRRSVAARLLRSRVRIPPGAWMFVCCEYCVWSGRGLCNEPITRPEESYLLQCVVVCDLENLKNEEAMTRVGSQHHREKKNYSPLIWPSTY